MKCLLCRSGQLNELLLGTAHVRQGNLVHQNCLYLSSNLVQHGDEVNDICCFTLTDIKAESRRTQNLNCCYCKRGGANIGCCNNSCRKTFHTYCGIKNGAQNQYTGTFKSFCNLHIQSYRERPTAQVKCAICMDRLIGEKQSFSFAKYIHGKCCSNGWYHRDCLQRYADSAGYFFKCPLCNDNDQFRLVALWGISVPDRDASWEQTDAYADQLEVPLNCTAVKCLNATGRKSTKYKLFYCTLCGANPMHPECTTFTADEYFCNDCEVVEKMSVSYLEEEEPLDPLEVFIANQQAMRKQTSSKIMPPRPPPADLSSDSEDDFDIIIATIERKRMEALKLGIRAPTRSGNVTPLSTAAPSNRMHNYQALPPVDNDTQRCRLRSSSRGATFATGLDEKQVENPERDVLPTSGTAPKRRTRSSSRLAKIVAEMDEIQLDSDEENPEKELLTSAAAARRTRSSSRLSNIAGRLEQRQVDSHKENHEKNQLPQLTAAVNRRGRSRSRQTANSAARLKKKAESEGDSDKENTKKQQPHPAVVVQSVLGNCLHARRITIAARLEEMQVDNDEDKPLLAPIVSRRQTCASPPMLQKDPSPLISRGRPRKRTGAPQQTQNVAVDISCIAKRTRARSRK